MAVVWAILIVGAAVSLWVLIALAAEAMLNNPRGDTETAIPYAAVRVYCRVMHRVRVEGAENIPAAYRGRRMGRGAGGAGPLIVAANHTAGIDPLLIQSACRFEVRWMMARDMLVPALDWMWEWARVIPVSRVWVKGEENRRSQMSEMAKEEREGADAKGVTRADSRSALEAIRHLREGGVLGVFPEGRIEERAGDLLAFLPGIGVIAKKTGAAVLPVVITGTPRGNSAWASLIKRSRSRVRFLPVVSYAETDLDARGIVEDLRGRMGAALGERQSGRIGRTAKRH